MLLWWKARRAHTVLPLALAVFAVFLLLVRDSSAELPALLPSFSGPVVTALLVPVPVCAGLMLCLGCRLDEAEQSGIRRVLVLDVLLVLVLLAATALLAAAVGGITDSSAAREAGRNTAFLCGLTLCLRPLLGIRAVLVPVVWIMAVAEAGYRNGHPLAWTAIARPLSDAYAAAAAATVVVAGLVAHLLTGTSEGARNPE